MDREFSHAEPFDKEWASLGGNDDDLRKLQGMILDNPRMYPVISGTGGARKIRFSLGKTGKSGGIRVVYADFPEDEEVFLLSAYDKHKKENLTKSECKAIKTFLQDVSRK
ncbi:MAG: addiction module toxin RelE [Defluviitaleaceae bacterium]|nr:addiction module toxin RelE [Defluviitaleaceae bacterium]